jgi:hypothetical protein
MLRSYRIRFMPFFSSRGHIAKAVPKHFAASSGGETSYFILSFCEQISPIGPAVATTQFEMARSGQAMLTRPAD